MIDFKYQVQELIERNSQSVQRFRIVPKLTRIKLSTGTLKMKIIQRCVWITIKQKHSKLTKQTGD